MGRININKHVCYEYRKLKSGTNEMYIFYGKTFDAVVERLLGHMDKFQVISYHIEECLEERKMNYSDWTEMHKRINKKLRSIASKKEVSANSVAELRNQKIPLTLLNFLRRHFNAGQRVFFVRPECDLTKLR